MYLRYLEDRGFEYSQKYVGRDKQGRDVFKFIDGFVPDDIGNTALSQLCDFMKIVRKFHDLSLEFTGSEVVCHNDLSLCNTVFANDRPFGLKRLLRCFLPCGGLCLWCL